MPHSSPEDIARSWSVTYVHSAVSKPCAGAKVGSVRQTFSFSAPHQSIPVPLLEVTVHISQDKDGTSSVAIEGSEYEYSGIAFASAAQSLLSAALEDKERRISARQRSVPAVANRD